MKTVLAIISIFFLLHCSEKSDQNKKLNEQDPGDLLQVDTTKILVEDGYYQFMPSTDSTSQIKWGNQYFSNMSDSAFDNYYFENGKIYTSASSDKFIAIARGNGSDTWTTFILPQIETGEVLIIENLMAIDEENGVIVFEYCCDSDSILIAENVITKKQQVIGLNWEKCSSAFNHYCIDSISITNKTLYLEWVTPNRFDHPNSKKTQRINLDL